MLIEVMIGAVILAIATAAVLDGLEGAQATGRKNKDRSVAATLAQQDLERLRALPISALVGLSQSRAVDVNGVNYTVTSKTTWMRDNSGELSCTDDTSQAAFLKVVSTAWAPAGSNRPVTETTLITPPTAYSTTHGTLTVKTTDRDAAPLANVTINLTGTASYTGTTNSLGCAIFSFIPAGKYAVTVPGNYVGPTSEKPVTTEAQVLAGKTTPKQLELGTPASLRINFKLPSGAATTYTKATVPHPDLPGGAKTFTSATAVTSIVAVNLFPQKDGYGVYAGDCETNNPANQYWGDPEYFLDHPASHAKVDPGSLLVPVDAVLPVLQLKVKHQLNQAVRLTLDAMDKPTADVDCREHLYNRVEIIAKKSSSSNKLTDSVDVPVPFGNYKVCVDDGSKRAVPTDMAMTKPQLIPTPELDLTSGTTGKACSPGY